MITFQLDHLHSLCEDIYSICMINLIKLFFCMINLISQIDNNKYIFHDCFCYLIVFLLFLVTGILIV